MPKQLTALAGDVFAGLFTRGVVDAGFKVLGALEHSGYGVATAKLNFPELDYRIGPQNWRPGEFAGKVDFMYTNPPCAAWSSMRVGTGKAGPSETWREEKARLGYINNLVQAGQIIQPKAWAWESVTNAWRHGRDFVLEQAEVWVNFGYHVTVLLQNNKFLGGNQHRPRMFLIAHRYPLVWQKFVEPPTLRQLLKGVRKVNKNDPRHPETPASLVKLWELSPKYGNVLRRALVTREGLGFKDVANLRPRPAMTVNRCKWDQTPGVFIGASKRMHPDEPRTLTWPEVLRVCGLPTDWQTAQGSLEPASLECSRAVMPGVGRWLAESVAMGLAQRPLKGPPLARLVDLQDPENPYSEPLFTGKAAGIGDAPVWAPEVPATTPKTPREPGQKAPRAAGGAPRLGSGYRIRCLLAEGVSQADILATIRREFPDSKATEKDVYWNKRKLAQNGGTP